MAAKTPDDGPEGCAAASATGSLGEVTVDGTRVRAPASWSVSRAVGALLELRTDSDRQLSRSIAGTAGELAWELDFRVGIGLCGQHVLQFHVYPGLPADDGGLSYCLPQQAVAKRTFEIVCRPQPRRLSCTWHCAADVATDIEWCDGECIAEIQPGLGPELPPWVPYWGLDGEQPAAGEPATELTFERTMSCTRGRAVTFAVASARRGRPSAPLRAPCGGD
jgi:hypothetical protein